MNAATRTMLTRAYDERRRLTRAEYAELTLLDRMRTMPDWMLPDSSTPTPEPVPAPVPVIHHMDDPPRVPEPGTRVQLYEGQSLVTGVVVDPEVHRFTPRYPPSADHVFVAYDLQWVYVAADGQPVSGDWVDYRLLTVIETSAQRTQRLAQQAAQKQRMQREVGLGLAMAVWMFALILGVTGIALGSGGVPLGIIVLVVGGLIGLAIASSRKVATVAAVAGTAYVAGVVGSAAIKHPKTALVVGAAATALVVDAHQRHE